MIEIKVENPEDHPKSVLRALAAFFTSCADSTEQVDLPRGTTVTVGAGTSAVEITSHTHGGGGFVKPVPAEYQVRAFGGGGGGAQASFGHGTGGQGGAGGSQLLGTITAAGNFVPAPPATIAPNDAPDAGAPTDDDVAAAQALAAFGGGGGLLNPAPFPFPGIIGVPPVPNAPLANVPDIAPAPALPTAAAPPNGVEVDKAGLPWDARIHSSNHEKNKSDGLWRARRNVDKAVVAAVEAELRGVMAIPNVPGIPPVPSSTAAPPVPATMLNAAAPPAVPSQPTGITFADLAPRVMQECTAQRMTQAQVAAACQLVGLPNFPSLAVRPDLVGQVYASLFPNG